MHITFVIPPPDLSGGIRVIAQHATWLAAHGHQVTVVYQIPEPLTVRKIVRSLIRDRQFIFRNRIDTTFFEKSRVTLKPLTKKDMSNSKMFPDGDIIVATWWETAEWVNDLPPCKGIKVYFIQGYEAFEYMPKDRVERTWTFPMQKIVVSKWLASLALEKFGDANAIVIPNGVDIHHFNTPVREKQVHFTVGFIYSDMFIKGVDIACTAIQQIRQYVPTLRIISFGSTRPTRHLPLPAGTEFHFRPLQKYIPKLYASCDVWLFTSRQEGFGLPILEAMACRTPVIATSAGAAPELLANGGGFLIPTDSPQSLVDTLMKVHHMSNQAWQELSLQARMTATQYPWEKSNQQFENVLIKLFQNTMRRDHE